MALTTVPASLSATALTLTTAAQPNITSVGTLTGLTVSGNIAGTLTTAAQTNITSVGTLSSLNVGAITSTGKLSLNDSTYGGWIQSNTSVRIDIDNDNNQTDRAFVVSKNNAATNLFMIKEDGNVGIDCVPVAKLQIKTQTNGNAAFQNSTSVSGGVKINAFNDAANASVPFELDGSSLQFNIAAVEAMRLNSSGQFFVGDGSPQWPTGTLGNSAGRHMFHHNGEAMLVLWDESTAAQGNAAYFLLGGKPVGSSNYFSGGRIAGKVENGSNAAGELILETTNTSGGVATALTLNSSQNAIFAGTISSGAITSSGNITAPKFIMTGGSQIGQDYAYLKSASTSTASLTLRKDSTGADSIDFLQLRSDGNGLIGKIEGDGDISFKDATFSGNVQLNSRLTFGYNSHYFESGSNSVAFKNSSGTAYITINNSGITTTGATVTGNSLLGNPSVHDSEARLQVAASDTSPDLSSATPASYSAFFTNSDGAYGTMFGSLGSGVGLIQQRRENVATTYGLSLQPYGGNVGIGTTNPQTTLHLDGSGTAERLRISRGSDDSGQFMDLQFNHIEINRSNVALASAQTDFSILQRGSDGVRTVFYVTSGGDIGIGSTSVFGATSNRRCFSVNGTSSTSLNIGVGGAQKVYMFSDGTYGRVATMGNIPLQLGNNDAPKVTIDVNGNLSVGSHGNAPNIIHKTNTSITAAQSAAGTWSHVSGESGVFSTRGAIEAAGIYNRHFYKWGFSGNLSANTFYPFTTRGDLVSAAGITASSDADGFGIYFRVYTYLSSSGYGEYASNRMSNMIWIHNFGSNSTQTHYFNLGPGFGHAPNAGDSAYGNAAPFILRVAHKMGNDSTFPANQVFEISCNATLTGLNAGVAGRQFLIYGYLL